MKKNPIRRLPNFGAIALLMLMFGCQTKHSADSRHVPSSTPNITVISNTSSPSENFLLIADGLSPDFRSRLRVKMGQLIQQANPGDVIHIIRTPDHRLLSTLVIPKAVGRDRLRDAVLAAGLGPVKAFLEDNSTVPADYRCQLGLPKLLDTFWGLRETSFQPRIALFGTPVFHDPTEMQWSFRNGRYPSDRSLTDYESTMPLRRLNRAQLPDDAEVIFVVDQIDWADGVHHQSSLIRFYSLAFEKQLGGQFLRLTSEVTGGFDSNVQRSFPQFDDFDSTLSPQMLVATDSGPIPVESFGHIPTEVKDAIAAAQANPRQILIAINWASRDSSTDIDLWLRSKDGHDELNFTRMKVDFGRLIRDVRTPGNPSKKDYGNWEVAIVDHDRLSDLTVWLNAFDGTGPTQVRLITVWKGNKTESEIPFAFRFGDHAKGHERRSISPAWKGPIDLISSPSVVAQH